MMIIQYVGTKLSRASQRGVASVKEENPERKDDGRCCATHLLCRNYMLLDAVPV